MKKLIALALISAALSGCAGLTFAVSTPYGSASSDGTITTITVEK